MCFPRSTMTLFIHRRGERDESWTCWIFLLRTISHSIRIHMQTLTTKDELIHLSPGEEVETKAQMFLEPSTLSAHFFFFFLGFLLSVSAHVHIHTHTKTHTHTHTEVISRGVREQKRMRSRWFHAGNHDVLETYHSRYMALWRGWLERDRKWQKQDL